MLASEVLVQLDAIEAMERGLAGQRKHVARAFLALRRDAGLSLRDVAPEVGITSVTINNIERGKTFRMASVRRLAKYYAKLEAA